MSEHENITRSVDDLDLGPTYFASDGQWGYEFARPRISEGRMPAVDASDDTRACFFRAGKLVLY